MSQTPDLGNTFGALLLSAIISALLCGVVWVQTFHYFQNYSLDHLYLKLVVFTLLLLETLHSICSSHAIYYYTIVNYFNPIALLDATWSLAIVSGISCVVVFIVHLFYIRQVYYLSSKNKILVALISILASGCVVATSFVTLKFFQLRHFSALASIVSYIDTALALTVATDITIAISLSVYLHKSRSGIQNTDTLINRLMMYTINNGLLTSMFDVVIIICTTVQPENLISLSIYQIVIDLYTISMLATLNSRRSMIQMIGADSTGISFRFSVSAQSMNRPNAIQPGVFSVNADDIELQHNE